MSEKGLGFFYFGRWVRALCHVISAPFGTAASPGERLGACLVPARALSLAQTRIRHQKKTKPKKIKLSDVYRRALVVSSVYFTFFF